MVASSGKPFCLKESHFSTNQVFKYNTSKAKKNHFEPQCGQAILSDSRVKAMIMGIEKPTLKMDSLVE